MPRLGQARAISERKANYQPAENRTNPAAMAKEKASALSHVDVWGRVFLAAHCLDFSRLELEKVLVVIPTFTAAVASFQQYYWTMYWGRGVSPTMSDRLEKL